MRDGTLDSEHESRLPWTGERYVPQVTGQIQLEHIHRYLLAREYAKEKDVLDIASGEGYGSAILANTARSVIGVDVAAEVIRHAAIRYQRNNLQFRHGSCVEIPLDNHSVDLVVSFETIEHLDEHKALMSEIKRVLRPAGVLIISSPDKKEYSILPNYRNPFHVRELFKEELEDLIRAYFKNLALFSQRVVYGSGILPESGAFPVTSYDLKDSSSSHPGLARPKYLIALASDAALPLLSGGLLEQAVEESENVKIRIELIAQLEDKIRQLEGQLHSQVAQSTIKVQQLEEQLLSQSSQSTERVRQLEEQLHFQVAESTSKVQQFEEQFHSQVAQSTSKIQQLEEQLLSQSSQSAERVRQVEDQLHSQVVQFSGKVRQLEEDVASVNLALDGEKRLRQRMTGSLSWRLTWPLRVLRDTITATIKNTGGNSHRTNRPNLKATLPDDAIVCINSLYRAAFGRIADQEGLAVRMLHLQLGVSLEVLAEELVGSPEFHARHGSDQNVDIQYLAALYRNGLGREPDPQGLAHWLAAGATRAKVLAAIASSHEALEKAKASSSANLSQGPLSDAESDILAGLFDERYYLEKNPSVASIDIAPFQHYRTIGWRKGLDPNPFFDTRWYLGRNPDAVSLGIDPLEHYCRYGWRQGLCPSPHFDSAWYLKAYPDVPAAEMEPLTHYLKWGLPHGRFPRSLDRELSESPNRSLAKWIDKCCTQFLSSSTQEGFPEGLRETLISKIGRALAARQTENPTEVSIIVPVHNNVDFTLISIFSVLMSDPRRSFELIIADDVSTDDTQSIFAGLPKPIRYLRWNHHHGFLKSCNAGARYADGKYLVFLNNDTIVFPTWLDSLVATLQNRPDAGLVGSKLLFANGRLQEAGGIIFSDASGSNFGRDDDPLRPEYNYLREVDYCSGCSFGMPKDLWTKLGGFDERFAPAYYEDADLCFRVRQAGMKVFYQPRSKLVHFEGISSGTSTSSGVKASQETNRPKFFDRWSSTIQHHGTGKNLARLADRYSRGRILVVDSIVPTPDQDAGSVAAFNFLRILKQLDKRVTFVPSDLRRNNHYASLLEEIGIECLCHPTVSSVREAIFHVGPEIEFAFLYRLQVAKSIIDLLRCHAPNAKVVFNTVDLHFLREKREADLTGGRWRHVKAESTKRDELEVICKADATIVLNESERVILNELLPTATVYQIGLPIETPIDNDITWESGRDVVFVGGFNHPPNTDAVLYFIREVWPVLQEQGYRDRFVIVGSNMPAEIKSLGTDRIIARGYVEDLAEAFGSARVSVAPLRFGAGLKGKVASSLGYGVPCVTTPIGVEGSGLLNGVNILVGDTPRDLASHILRLYENRQLWTELSQNGLRFFRDNYSLESIKPKFEQLMTALTTGKK
jgi:GT2 family glycosyltransferase/glycosyltransferase involved in cell wall biosynthesis/SAM-dependent methyltransferase